MFQFQTKIVTKAMESLTEAPSCTAKLRNPACVGHIRCNFIFRIIWNWPKIRIVEIRVVKKLDLGVTWTLATE